MLNKSFLLFLAGCFSLTQIKIIGYIGITELVFYFIAPIIYFQNRQLLTKHGFNKVLLLAGLWAVNGLISDWYRQNTFENTIKGFATVYCMLSSIIVMHALLWNDPWRVRWASLGFTVSVVLSAYVFQGGAFVEMALSSGMDYKEATLSYKLTWTSIVGSIGALPIIFYYMKIPLISAVIYLGLGIFSLLEGGRSGFLVSLFSVGLIFVAKNNPRKMRNIQRNFYGLAILLIIMGFVASKTYKVVVQSGHMGESELQKYEIQSQSKLGIMSGRSAFVGSMLALKDSPLIGYGSWARDWKGYNEKAAILAGAEELPRQEIIPLMPGHSYLFSSWVYNGLFGGLFWIYILWVLYKTIKYNMGVIPKLYGYLALTIPPLIWNIFFSPLAGRIIVSTSITMVLLLEFYQKCQRDCVRQVPPSKMHH